MKKMVMFILTLVMILGITGTMDVNASPMGKNIFNKNGGDVLADTGLTLEGVYESTTLSDLTEWYTPIDANTQYVFSGGATMGVGLYDADYNWISRIITSNVFTTSANTAYIRIYTNSLVMLLDTLQIEEGSVATVYEAYIPSADEFPAVNLFNRDGGQVLLDNWFSVIGTLESHVGSDVADWYITLQPETNYVISGIENYGVILYDSYFNSNGKIYPVDGTFLTNSSIYYMKIYGDNLYENLDLIQIEEGTVATSYQAYIDQAPTLSGDVVIFSDVAAPITLAYIKSALTAIDEIDGDLSANIVNTYDGYSGNSGVLGDYQTEWSVTDSSSNTVVISVIIRVSDIAAPYLLSSFTNIDTVGTDVETLTQVMADVVILDAYDGDLTINYIFTVDNYTANIGIPGAYDMTLTVQDSSGNELEHSFTITVTNDEPPIWSWNTLVVFTITAASSMTQDEIRLHLLNR